MTSILCLAHYCDLHGPTPLMVTEGLPVPCNVCYDDELHDRPGSGPDRPRSGVPMPGGESTQATTAITEALRRMNFADAQRSSSLPATEQEAQTHRAALRRAAQVAASSSSGGLGGSAMETPPQSPQLPPEGAPPNSKQQQQQQQQQHHHHHHQQTPHQTIYQQQQAYGESERTLEEKLRGGGVPGSSTTRPGDND